ncbi:hypothetical protein GCM10007415_04340 [Parapedobacter pyrenivorans]|uniref:Uncharacterized protein n=1 Tax=Parapedobacter pyrenivorans TaxID=1305674 RepID=A0A917M2Y2_9SPHI|nr:DUF6266 family protein [Parapedobacter pyrenivorans]GGG75836.1 hypothetical protein GCM10007415_04340 [Parapedobacter pyrenivorans]
MAILKDGINGPFSGKVGSVVGSSWRKINYIKGFRRIKETKPEPSPKQAAQHRRFKLLNGFLRPVAEILETGFGQFTGRSTAVNAAFSHNYGHAFRMDGDDLTLNYRELAFSRGTLYTAGAERAWLENGGIRVRWDPRTYGVGGEMDDVGHAIAHHPESGLFFGGNAQRHAGEVAFSFNGHASGGEFHVWLFFADSRGKRASRTVYIPLTGPVS